MLVVFTASFSNRNKESINTVDKATPVLKAAAGSKKEAIRLHPNPSTNGRITVSSNLTETLHFYVFDLEGTLLHQIVLKDKQKKTIENLDKGIYVYDAFLNDEGIVHGNIIVK